MQTRYYDPEIRRFVNADNYELIPTLAGTVGQLNVFAYANNNPIMYTDETGEFAISISVYVGITICFLLLEIVYLETTTHCISSTLNFIIDQISNGINTLGDHLIVESKRKKEKKNNRDPDPHARPGQKKQGRELKSKSRLNPNFKQRNGRRRGPQPPKHHTPGRDHRKFLLLLLLGNDTIFNIWFDR